MRSLKEAKCGSLTMATEVAQRFGSPCKFVRRRYQSRRAMQAKGNLTRAYAKNAACGYRIGDHMVTTHAMADWEALFERRARSPLPVCRMSKREREKCGKWVLVSNSAGGTHTCRHHWNYPHMNSDGKVDRAGGDSGESGPLARSSSWDRTGSGSTVGSLVELVVGKLGRTRLGHGRTIIDIRTHWDGGAARIGTEGPPPSLEAWCRRGYKHAAFGISDVCSML